MGIAPSLPPATEIEYKPWDAAAVTARQRSFEFFESLDPGRAFRWVQHAWFMYKLGGGVERARPVFRAALARVADYHYIYCAWTNMEEQEGEAAAARELFEEWRARRASAAEDGGERDQDEAESWFWRRYLAFELDQGDAERARAVAEAAVAARPGDVMLRAKHVLAEMRLGDDERARAAFEGALAAFAADADAEKRLAEEVRRGGGNLSEKSFGGGCLLFLCRGWWFFRPPWWEQI